jgi:hypothetical protein
MSLSPRKPGAYTNFDLVAARAGNGCVLGKQWNASNADATLVSWLTGHNVEVGLPARSCKPFTVAMNEMRVVNKLTIVARVPSYVVVIAADHVAVKLKSTAPMHVAANVCTMMPVNGVASVTLRVRDNEQCGVALIPARAAAELMDTHGAQNVALRVLQTAKFFNVPGRHNVWRKGVQDGAACEAILKSTNGWVCSSCSYTCTNAASMWKHLKRPLQTAPAMHWRCFCAAPHFSARVEDIWEHQHHSKQCSHYQKVLTPASIAQGWTMLIDAPPDFGSPMDSHAEGTLGDVDSTGHTTVAARKQKADLYARLWKIVAKVGNRTTKIPTNEYRTAQQYYCDIGAVVIS